MRTTITKIVNIRRWTNGLPTPMQKIPKATLKNALYDPYIKGNSMGIGSRIGAEGDRRLCNK